MKSLMGMVLTAVSLTAPLLVRAAEFENQPPESIVSREAKAGRGTKGASDLIDKAGGWFYGILAALAVIFIIYSGYLFLTAGGDEEKVKTARKFLVYAVIAVAVAILATGIVAVVKIFFGAA